MRGSCYLFSGDARVLKPIRALLLKEGMGEGHPDLYVREYLSFGVEDARELRERSYGRPIRGGGRAFVVVTPTMTVEAQNALLKVLEEPPADASFFFVVPAPESLLSTFRSRASALVLPPLMSRPRLDIARKNIKDGPLYFGAGDEHDNVVSFLSASPEKRLDMLKPLYTHEDEERDVRGAIALLGGLERALAGKLGNTTARESLRAVYRARKYVTDKGALLKPLLEHVALLVPRM